MMANGNQVNVILRLLQGFFQRNNPVTAIVYEVNQKVDFVMNFTSHRKLMKYRSIVYIQQLQKMERNLWSGVAAPEGDKLDRYY
jgi:hypothetical protein